MTKKRIIRPRSRQVDVSAEPEINIEEERRAVVATYRDVKRPSQTQVITEDIKQLSAAQLALHLKIMGIDTYRHTIQGAIEALHMRIVEAKLEAAETHIRDVDIAKLKQAVPRVYNLLRAFFAADYSDDDVVDAVILDQLNERSAATFDLEEDSDLIDYDAFDGDESLDEGAEGIDVTVTEPTRDEMNAMSLQSLRELASHYDIHTQGMNKYQTINMIEYVRTRVL